MLLRDIVKLFIPAKELKVRAGNGQIKVNNIAEKDINVDIPVSDNFVTLGDFVFNCIKDGINLNFLKIVDLKDLFNGPCNIKGLEFFENFVLISISKTDLYVFNKINNMDESLDFPKELIEFMETFDDDDLSDGAWQQMLEDSVEHYNKANNTNYNSLDAFIYYCTRNNK